MLVESVLQRLGLHDVGVLAAAVGERGDAGGAAFLVGVDDEVQLELLGDPVPEGDHVPELPRRVDVQEGERESPGVEGLAGEVQEHGRVLADRIEQHRTLELRSHLADDVDAFGFELLQVGERVARHRLVRLKRCSRGETAGCALYGVWPGASKSPWLYG